MPRYGCAFCGALPGFPRQCSPSLAFHLLPKSAPNWRSEEAHRVNTVLNQPNRHCVSTDRLHRIDSQLVSSLGGEFNPTPAGKTPHTHTPKPCFGGRGLLTRVRQAALIGPTQEIPKRRRLCLWRNLKHWEYGVVDAMRLGAWLRSGEVVGWLATGTIPNSLYRGPFSYFFFWLVVCV